MQKGTKYDPPLQFKNEEEVKEFETRIRRVHHQLILEEPDKAVIDASWWKRKAPGIAKKLFPPRSHHENRKE